MELIGGIIAEQIDACESLARYTPVRTMYVIEALYKLRDTYYCIPHGDHYILPVKEEVFTLKECESIPLMHRIIELCITQIETLKCVKNECLDDEKCIEFASSLSDLSVEGLDSINDLMHSESTLLSLFFLFLITTLNQYAAHARARI